MVPRPVALGLCLCERVIVEKESDNVSLINLFTRAFAPKLPGAVPPFCVFATLTGSVGSGIVELNLTLLRTMETVANYRHVVAFPDRLTEVRVNFRLNRCELPEAGRYQAELLVDGEWIAQRSFEVIARP